MAVCSSPIEGNNVHKAVKRSLNLFKIVLPVWKQQINNVITQIRITQIAITLNFKTKDLGILIQEEERRGSKLSFLARAVIKIRIFWLRVSSLLFTFNFSLNSKWASVILVSKGEYKVIKEKHTQMSIFPRCIEHNFLPAGISTISKNFGVHGELTPCWFGKRKSDNIPLWGSLNVNTLWRDSNHLIIRSILKN